ncbi:cytochrome P450 3A19-like [Nylanderia fulva]|uniref:cytochrome P450 3A19-like n=1 Tax=Nylanderia fulva TaxID=613905 RepID=UPI0010FB3D6A|nr:cytochrome P450 3A19-like [Nylanderia fulva]
MNYFKKHNKRPFPILENMEAIIFCRQSVDLVKDAYDLHPKTKYVDMFDMTNPLVVIRDPELIKSIGERKKENLNSGAYLSFGLGPRMCIGNRFVLMETKILLFHLLARCNLKAKNTVTAQTC